MVVKVSLPPFSGEVLSQPASCLADSPSATLTAGKPVCSQELMFWAHVLGTQMVPVFMKAQHTGRTCRHMDKYFAFLFRQYLNLSYLIAVKGRKLSNPGGKANSEGSWGLFLLLQPGSLATTCMAWTLISCSC